MAMVGESFQNRLLTYESAEISTMKTPNSSLDDRAAGDMPAV